MVEYVNIVVCRHPNVRDNFVFKAPDPDSVGNKLKAGEYVLVTTCKGPNQIARCITDQFRISSIHLKEFYGADVKQLKPVTAYLKPICVVYEHCGEE